MEYAITAQYYLFSHLAFCYSYHFILSTFLHKNYYNAVGIVGKTNVMPSDFTLCQDWYVSSFEGSLDCNFHGLELPCVFLIPHVAFLLNDNWEIW